MFLIKFFTLFDRYYNHAAGFWGGCRVLDKLDFSEIEQSALFVEERRMPNYLLRHKEIAVELNRLPDEHLLGVDAEKLARRQSQLVYFQIKGIAEQIPMDLEHLGLLRVSHLARAGRELFRVRHRLLPRHRRICDRLRSDIAPDLLLHFPSLQMHALEKKTIQFLYGCRARMDDQPAPMRLDILREGLIQASWTLAILHSVGRAVSHPHHPSAIKAKIWLNRSSFRGSQGDLELMIMNAETHIIEAYNDLYQLVPAAAELGLPDRPGPLDGGSYWFDLGSNRLEHRVDADLPGCPARGFEETFAQWDAENFRRKKNHFLDQDGDPGKLAGRLTRLMNHVEERIRTAAHADGLLMTSLETEYRAGIWSDFAYREQLERLQTNWTGLVWLYLELFDALCALKENHPAVYISEAMAVAGAKRAKSWDLPVEIGQLIERVDWSSLEDMLEDLDETDDMGDLYLFKQLLVTSDQLDGEIDNLHPRHLLRGQLSKIPERRYAAWNEALNELYGKRIRLERYRRQTNTLLALCFEHLNVHSRLNPCYEARCLRLMADRMLEGARNGNFQMIRAELFEQRLNLAMQEPDEAPFRLMLLARLMGHQPILPELIDAVDQLREAGERRQERYVFLLHNGMETAALQDRVRVALREHIGEDEPYRVRLVAMGLAGCQAEVLIDRYRAAAATMEHQASLEGCDQVLAELTRLEEEINEARRVCAPDGPAVARLRKLYELGLLPKQLVARLQNDLATNLGYFDLCEEEMAITAGELNKLRRQLGDERPDMPYLDHQDVHDLLRSYDLLDDLALLELKRFAAYFRHRARLLDRLFDRARDKDPSLPEAIRNSISPRIHSVFKHHHTYSSLLKVVLLRNSPELARAESQFLVLLLEYAKPEKLEWQRTVTGLLEMFRLSERGDARINRDLEDIWSVLHRSITAAIPGNYRTNFAKNRDALISWVTEIKG